MPLARTFELYAELWCFLKSSLQRAAADEFGPKAQHQRSSAPMLRWTDHYCRRGDRAGWGGVEAMFPEAVLRILDRAGRPQFLQLNMTPDVAVTQEPAGKAGRLIILDARTLDRRRVERCPQFHSYLP